MRAYIGVTDWDWYRLLREVEPLEEINFWQPGGKHRFGALEPGELFLFKLHSPRNFIVGGGIFVYSTILPVSLAWESFEQKNGALSFEAMRRRIEKYRRTKGTPFDDYDVGCILLAQPFFLAESEWIPTPADWAPNIVQGKRYDLDREPGISLLRQLQFAMSRDKSGFNRAIQAGDRRVQNGILLRSDLHTLFDRGYLTVKPDLQLEVSQRLHEDFHNGRDYYALRGRSLRAPPSLDSRPNAEFLSWHNQNIYRG